MNAPVNYALEHLHWPFIVGAAWWVRGVVTKFLEKVDDTHGQVTNHLPTILNEQTEILRTMDRNIAIMASNRREPRG